MCSIDSHGSSCFCAPRPPPIFLPLFPSTALWLVLGFLEESGEGGGRQKVRTKFEQQTVGSSALAVFLFTVKLYLLGYITSHLEHPHFA